MTVTPSSSALENQPARPDRLRVLVIAEAANPEWVSVPLVGWSTARALMKQHDVHLVTQTRNRDAILRAGLVEGRDFTVIDNEAVASPVHRLAEKMRMGEGKGWTLVTALSSRLSYPVFERMVWKRFKADIRSGRFDVVHRVTPLTPTANSSLASKCDKAGVPFVLGPLNGGVPWPAGFDAQRREEREWLSYLRGLYKLSPARIRMLRAASAIIAGSRFTAGDMPASEQGKVCLIPENAIDPERFNRVCDQDISGPLRGCFVGRLVPYKGPDMLIDAAEPFLKSGQMTLDIVGDGPMMDELQEIVARRELDKAVRFHGWLDHGDVQNVLAGANLLTFPSVREFGGGVVLEAMALGTVPVICDYAGPGELVTEGTGFKVPMGSRNRIVQGFREQLGALVADPSVLPDIARAARKRVADYFTWDRKADQITSIYQWALTGLGPIPQPVPLASGDARTRSTS